MGEWKRGGVIWSGRWRRVTSSCGRASVTFQRTWWTLKVDGKIVSRHEGPYGRDNAMRKGGQILRGSAT